ncbi:MAG: hypothetical protein P4L84_35765 [Isosphaeraceae bacterium]|nr:hypothetical protein [Isosphaeraceae bacterium]
MDPGAAAEPDRARWTDRRFRALLGCATFVMLGLSWPLWTAPEEAFPRVPFLRLAAWAGEPAAVAWIVYAVLLAAVAAAALARRGWKWAAGGSAVLLAALVVQDQHRFQPWVYQFLVLDVVLLAFRPERALRYARWWFGGLYFHSALSKLDVSFTREMGAVFLASLTRPFGADPALWPDRWRDAAILAMPAAEGVVAVLLVLPRTRRVGLAGALVLHALLIAILGPWGLGHSTIVLVWNAAMMGELCVLFGPDLAPRGKCVAGARDGWCASAVRILFWCTLVAPFGERWGLLDAWPAHALYASHVERTAVFLFEDELATYPAAVRRYLVGEGEGPWRRLDLTAWSRAVRGTPVYPSARACNGLAEALAARYRGPHPVRVLQWSRADRWTGRRDVAESLGLDAIRRQGNRYWWNAHPRPSANEGHGHAESTIDPGG